MFNIKTLQAKTAADLDTAVNKFLATPDLEPQTLTFYTLPGDPEPFVCSILLIVNP